MADLALHSTVMMIRREKIKALSTRKDRRMALTERRKDLVNLIQKPVLDLEKVGDSRTNEDIKNLAEALKGNTITTTLNLVGNEKITNKSAAILLKALEKNTTLQFINLDGTGMTDKAKENFRRKLAKKFAEKTPGFFERLWQRIVNVFSKSEVAVQPVAVEALAAPPEAKHFPDVNIKALNNKTPLMRMISQGNLEMVEWLLSKPEIDLTAKDDNGYTVLNYAVESNNPDILKVVLSHLTTLPEDTMVQIYDASEVEVEGQGVVSYTIRQKWYKTHKIGMDSELDTLLQNINNIANPPEYQALEAERAQVRARGVNLKPNYPEIKQTRQAILDKVQIDKSKPVPPLEATPLTEQDQGPVETVYRGPEKTDPTPAIGGPKKNKPIQFTTTISTQTISEENPEIKTESSEPINLKPRK